MADGYIGTATVLYDYYPPPGDANMLTLSAGTTINVMRQDDSGWWAGELNGQVGLFPATYVEMSSYGAAAPGMPGGYTASGAFSAVGGGARSSVMGRGGAAGGPQSIGAPIPGSFQHGISAAPAAKETAKERKAREKKEAAERKAAEKARKAAAKSKKNAPAVEIGTPFASNAPSFDSGAAAKLYSGTLKAAPRAPHQKNSVNFKELFQSSSSGDFWPNGVPKIPPPPLGPGSLVTMAAPRPGMQRQSSRGILSVDSMAFSPKSAATAASRKQIRALYEYAGSTENGELSFPAGVTMTLFKKHDEAWWEAEYNGQKGYVPAEWFEEVQDTAKPLPTTPSAAASAVVSPTSSRSSVAVVNTSAPPPPPMPGANDAAAAPAPAAGGFLGSIAAAAKQREERAASNATSPTSAGSGGGGSGKSKVKGLFDFEAASESEMSFAAGDVLTLIEKTDNIWWEVENSQGVRGFVPVDFVEEVPGSRRQSLTKRLSAGAQQLGGIFAGGFPTLKKTQAPEPKPVESSPSPGGLFAGGFPSLKKTSGDGDLSRFDKFEKKEKKDEQPTFQFALRKTGRRSSKGSRGGKKPSPPKSGGGAKPAPPSGGGAKPAPPPGPPPKENLAAGDVEAEVLYDFTPDGPTELGLTKGTTIVVINMADDEWWEARDSQGNQGYFPKAYVAIKKRAPRPPPM